MVFFKVIQWATHHKDDPPPPDDDENKEKRTDDIDPWDQEFLKVDQGTLFELILVSERQTKNNDHHHLKQFPWHREFLLKVTDLMQKIISC